MPRLTKITPSHAEGMAPNAPGILEPVLEMLPRRSNAVVAPLLTEENINGGFHQDAKGNCNVLSVCLKRDQSEDIRYGKLMPFI